jgi:predicted alpha/beta superfamily hydrolase
MRIDIFDTQINALNRLTKIHVMVPNKYELTKKRYPVLYINDGQDVFYDEEAFGNAESLRFAQYYKDYAKYLPEIILVAIEAPKDSAMRTAQYSPYTKDFNVPKGKRFESHIEGKGKEYLNWLTTDLKKEIDNRYRTMPERDYTGICGYSTGSLNSIYAVLHYPQVFSRLIAMSSAVCIWMDCLEKTLKSSNYSHLKYVYLDVGTNEFGRMTTKEEFMQGSKIIYNYFTDNGVGRDKLKFNIYDGATHDQKHWRTRFPDAIRWIYRDL